MTSNKWTEAHIATVGAAAVNFPTAEVLHWSAMRQVPKEVRAALAETEAAMSALETSTEFRPDAIASRRKALAKEAITGLQKRSKIDAARAAADRRKEALKAKAPKPAPKTAEEISLAAEIRAHLAKTEKSERLITATNLVRQSKQAADAILGAPGFLTGLTEAELATLRGALPPDETPEVKEIGAIDAAIKVLDGALTSATSMIATRAGLLRNAEGAWQ